MAETPGPYLPDRVSPTSLCVSWSQNMRWTLMPLQPSTAFPPSKQNSIEDMFLPPTVALAGGAFKRASRAGGGASPAAALVELEAAAAPIAGSWSAKKDTGQLPSPCVLPQTGSCGVRSEGSSGAQGHVQWHSFTMTTSTHTYRRPRDRLLGHGVQGAGGRVESCQAGRQQGGRFPQRGQLLNRAAGRVDGDGVHLPFAPYAQQAAFGGELDRLQRWHRAAAVFQL